MSDVITYLAGISDYARQAARDLGALQSNMNAGGTNGITGGTGGGSQLGSSGGSGSGTFGITGGGGGRGDLGSSTELIAALRELGGRT